MYIFCILLQPSFFVHLATYRVMPDLCFTSILSTAFLVSTSYALRAGISVLPCINMKETC